MTETNESRIDRRSLWLAIVAGVGVVIAIVALILAISAKSATNNNAKVTAQVKQDANLAVAGVHGQLQRDVASATVVLQQLTAESRTAALRRAQLLHDVNANKAGVAVNRETIVKMEASINTLTADVNKLNTSVTTLTTNQQALTKKVDAIVKK